MRALENVFVTDMRALENIFVTDMRALIEINFVRVAGREINFDDDDDGDDDDDTVNVTLHL